MRQASEHSPGPPAAQQNELELALLARIAAQDAQAMHELYHLYHRRLARFLMRLTSRYDLAEEIINDTFWVIWQHAADFRGASQVSTWVFGIAYRRGLKTLKRLRPDLIAEEGEAPEQLVAAVVKDDRLGDDGAEPRHAVGQPLRHPSAVQRQIGVACPPRHRSSLASRMFLKCSNTRRAPRPGVPRRAPRSAPQRSAVCCDAAASAAAKRAR